VTPICCLLLLAAPLEGEFKLRYLRPQGDGWATESLVEGRDLRTGWTYTSKTDRPGHTLTLTFRRVGRRLLEADIKLVQGKETTTARVVREGDAFKLTRQGKTETIKAPADPVVTSAPDWSDILGLVGRYDRNKGLKQEFAGLWFHPTQPHRLLAFTVEKTGTVKVQHQGKPLDLEAFRVTIRSGGYKVWALPTGEVARILPDGDKATPVVLEGYTETTKGLR
jgi:hypothetical protein